MASILKVDKLDPQSGTALEIGSSGDTITIPSGATFTQSGTMNASAITAGTIDTARLGSGTASSSTVLYGDQTYKAEPGGGKILQIVNATGYSTSSSYSDVFQTSVVTDAITPSATSSKILIHIAVGIGIDDSNQIGQFAIFRDTTDLSDASGNGMINVVINDINSPDDINVPLGMTWLDSPSSTSSIDYTLKYRCVSGNSTIYVNTGGSSAIGTWSIVLMEVDGS